MQTSFVNEKLGYKPQRILQVTVQEEAQPSEKTKALKRKRPGDNIVQPAVYNESVSLNGTHRTIETQTFVGNVLFPTRLLREEIPKKNSPNETQRRENQLWIMKCQNEKIRQENTELKFHNEQLLILLSKMDFILSRVGAKSTGNTHPFYPLMVPVGAIVQDKPIAPHLEPSQSNVSQPDVPQHQSWLEFTDPSCKTEINDDVAIIIEISANQNDQVKNETDEPEIIEIENDNDIITEKVIEFTPSVAIPETTQSAIEVPRRTGPYDIWKRKYGKSQPKDHEMQFFVGGDHLDTDNTCTAQNDYPLNEPTQSRSLRLLSIEKDERKRKITRPAKLNHPLKGYIFHIEQNDMVSSPENPEVFIPSSKPKYYRFITEFISDVFKDHLHLTCINHKRGKYCLINSNINCRARLTLFINTDRLVTIPGQSFQVGKRINGSGHFSWSHRNKHDDYFDIENYCIKEHHCTKLCYEKICSQSHADGCEGFTSGHDSEITQMVTTELSAQNVKIEKIEENIIDIYKLKEVLCNQYQKVDVERYNRSLSFLIENTNTGEQSLFQLDRISIDRAAIRCNNRACGHRLSIEHIIPTVPYDKGRGHKIAASVKKADLMDLSNWFKIYHQHTKRCVMKGPVFCTKTLHVSIHCQSKTESDIIKRKYPEGRERSISGQDSGHEISQPVTTEPVTAAQIDNIQIEEEKVNLNEAPMEI